jgi:hypothetical protein
MLSWEFNLSTTSIDALLRSFHEGMHVLALLHLKKMLGSQKSDLLELGMNGRISTQKKYKLIIPRHGGHVILIC